MVQFSQITIIPAHAARSIMPSIEHVVLMVKENHTFDNYFGLFEGANGFSLPHAINPHADLPHSRDVALAEFNDGKMDGFTSNAKSQYYEADIPHYWAYADNFALCDNFFSSVLGPSFPNHLYMIAAQSGGIIDEPMGADERWGWDANANARVAFLDENGKRSYRYPGIDIKTVGDILEEKGRTWKYYTSRRIESGELWSPYKAIKHIYNTAKFNEHVVDNEEFERDISNDDLPDMSWLLPSFDLSEHPGKDISAGEAWSVRMINSLMSSRAWNTTALFMVWDDYGGWYDHVPPPQIDRFGLGFRVPCIVISPYVKNEVSHVQYDFTSILKFVETLFGLPSLTERDKSANDMMCMFDTEQEPNKKLTFEE